MKLKIVKGRRKKYKSIIFLFLIVILTGFIGILAKQRIKIANLSRQNLEIKKIWNKKTKII